jgi:hypothetical protein
MLHWSDIFRLFFHLQIELLGSFLLSVSSDSKNNSQNYSSCAQNEGQYQRNEKSCVTNAFKRLVRNEYRDRIVRFCYVRIVVLDVDRIARKLFAQLWEGYFREVPNGNFRPSTHPALHYCYRTGAKAVDIYGSQVAVCPIDAFSL